MSTLRKLLKYVGKYLPLLLVSVVLLIVSTIIQLYIPIEFGNAIDRIVSAGKVDFNTVAEYLKIITGLLILSGVCTWLAGLINNKIAYSTIEQIRDKAIRQVQVLPLSYLDSHASGDIVQRIIGDTDQLSEGLILGFNQFVSGIVTIITTLYFMFIKSTSITFIVIFMTPISFLVAGIIAYKSHELFASQTNIRGKQTALINEMVSNEKLVKAFGYETKASSRFKTINDDLRKHSQKAIFYSSLTNPATRAVNNIIYAVVAFVGFYEFASARISVGDVVTLLTYANQYMKPFNEISSVITEMQNSLACAERVFELIEAKPQSKDPDKELIADKGQIDIENVYFSYDKDKKLIEDFSFKGKPGMTIAIVGPTGCGKTTLINLLMRFYDVDKGSIKVDGQDINTVSRSSLRKQYGMVLQDTWLKNASIRENIAFGKQDASDEEIIEAAKKTHSWDFIKRMPEGLDTIIDDNSLSQGQKQLLCITRVMLCMPPMLILDEATSSIDTRTEIYIQKAFEDLMKNRTSFIVAHRLSTIRNADHILVMNEGKIIEQGTHLELLNKGGFYTQLYNSQFEVE